MGLPGDCQLEFVNGGHGIKNPLAIEGQRQTAVGRDEDRVNRPPSGKVNYSLKREIRWITFWSIMLLKLLNQLKIFN